MIIIISYHTSESGIWTNIALLRPTSIIQRTISAPWGVYRLCDKFALLSKIIHMNHLCPHRYPFTWVERSNYTKVSCSETQVSWPVRTHTLLIRNTRALVRCSKPLGHDTQQGKVLGWTYISSWDTLHWVSVNT